MIVLFDISNKAHKYYIKKLKKHNKNMILDAMTY